MSGAGGEGGFTASPRRAWVVDPLQWRRRGVVATGRALFIRQGLLARELVVVPHEKTQSISITQGPLQRPLSLATIEIHSTNGSVHPVAKHLALEDAIALLDAQSRAGAGCPPHARRPSSGWRRSRGEARAASTSASSGAGRVGAVLGAALRIAEHRVVAASGVSEQSRSRIETLLPGTPQRDAEAVVRAADLVLLTAPDDALAPLVAGLAAVGAWRPGQIAVHASGRLGLAPLRPAMDAGVTRIAAHPAMTFTGTSVDLARLREAVFAVTAPAPVSADRPGARRRDGGRARRRRGRGSGAVPRRRRPRGEPRRRPRRAGDGAPAGRRGSRIPRRCSAPSCAPRSTARCPRRRGAAATLTGPVVRADVGHDRRPRRRARGASGGAGDVPGARPCDRDLARDSGRIDDAQYAGVMDVLEERS